jgi:hypothetical protein
MPLGIITPASQPQPQYQEITMQFHLTFEAYETIIGNDVPALRKHAATGIQRLMESGKVVSGGLFQGKRGGYMVMNADSGEELFGLVADLVDCFNITVTPTVGFEVLGDFFKNNTFSWG